VTEALARPRPIGLSGPIFVSAVLHIAVVGAYVWSGLETTRPMPPIYKVQLIAAPAGERAEGVVTSAPAPETKAAPRPAPESRKSTETKTAKKASKAPVKAATPSVAKAPPSKAAPPEAGGGEQGGAGADVVNVNTLGIDFPFPGYLQGIVRQIALAFEVPKGAQSLTAEVSFMIRRDGSVTGVRLLTSSKVYTFDQNALAAIEIVGKSLKFGPLPKEFSDDVLPVIFSFDPKRMR
jgi:TonB family protein